MSIKRIFVSKKDNSDAKKISQSFQKYLGLNIQKIKVYRQYDFYNLPDSLYKRALNIAIYEPTVDNIFENIEVPKKSFALTSHYLPGQYDQEADSMMQVLQILRKNNENISNLKVESAKVYVFDAVLSNLQKNKIKNELINSVESVGIVGFKDKKPLVVKKSAEIKVDISKQYNKLALSIDDKNFIKTYFNSIKRKPTETELKVLDTYWSDHCRHSTFLTELTNIKFENEIHKRVFDEYISDREKLKVKKPITLMDLATLSTKIIKASEQKENFDISKEVNACSFVVDAKAKNIKTGKISDEKYVVMFKNETHNHPTEIEPFGGAATCLGGAIRDPLSGRSYVYGAIRISGAANPFDKNKFSNKLPQRKIISIAAKGYSSYGNQIGLATGIVDEIYHPNYVAKRLELGAVVGANLKKNIIRKEPKPGDRIILIGGRTGKDGIGGATGSSVKHNEKSLNTSVSEVQKGNPVTERKIQRLFRNPIVSKMILRCNDFGAGGVSVAIGELADGVEVNLNKVPLKYQDLMAFEIAISESQERMAVVVDAKNVKKFITLSNAENLEATEVGKVTKKPNMTFYYNNKKVVDLERKFLDSNGAKRVQNVTVKDDKNSSLAVQFKKGKYDFLNSAIKNSLTEMFDSTVGGNTVFMPYGGIFQKTPVEAMIHRIPIIEYKKTYTGTAMTYGFNPFLMEKNQFLGAIYAHIEALSKFVAVGGDIKNAWFSLQEYFEKLENVPEKWGNVLKAMLGALWVQKRLNIPAIGGKDSMSGTFEHKNNKISVPPTVVAFVCGPVDTKKVVSNEFKKAGNYVSIIKSPATKDNLPSIWKMKKNFDLVTELINSKSVVSVQSIKNHALDDAIYKSCAGNNLGFEYLKKTSLKKAALYGNFLLESKKPLKDIETIGKITKNPISKKVTNKLQEVYYG